MDTFLAYLEIGVRDGLIYGLLALGLVLIYKGSRVLNFAHPFFGLLAAFLAWWLTDRAGFLPFEATTRPRFFVAALVAIALVALNGYSIERNVFRHLRGSPRLVLLVATIALASGTFGLVILLFNRNADLIQTARSLPSVLNSSFSIGDRVVTGADLEVLLLVPLICAGLGAYFKLTKFGIAIRAAAENGDSARLLGISVDRVSSFTWIVGSALAGLAGIMITEVRGSLDITTLSTGFLIRGLAAALIGGLTSLPGAITGGLVVGLGESMIRWQTARGQSLDFLGSSGAAELLLFLLVVGFLVFRPGGLFGAREETEDKAAFVPVLRELPAHLRRSAAARGVRVVGWSMVAVLCLFSLVTGAKVNGAMIDVVVIGMVGVSLTVLMGYAGQISLGHWGLAGFGAFMAANLFTRMHVPYLLALPLTVVFGMLISLVIGLPALRVKGLYLAIVTLAFNLACEYWLFKQAWFARTTSGVQLSGPKLGPFDLDAPSLRPLFFFSVLCLLIVLWVARNLALTRTGRGFFALRENEKAAATLGIGLTQYRLLAFVVSGGIAALAGALHATHLGFAQSDVFPTATSLTLVAMVVIGGLGSLSGAIYGAFLVFGLVQFLEFANDWVVFIGVGVLLIVVIVRAPGGVAGLVHAIRTRLVVALDDLARQQQPAAQQAAPTPTPPSSGA